MTVTTWIRILLFFIIMSAASIGFMMGQIFPRHTARYELYDTVTAKECPEAKDLIVKEFTRDGDVWVEPACSGPRGLYPYNDLTLVTKAIHESHR